MRMKLLFGLALWCALIGTSSGTVYIQSITRLYHTYNSTTTDNFYTINKAERDASISCCSFVDQGITAWVLNKYANYDTRAYDFQRWYGGSPYTTHFYTISPSEASTVSGMGFVYETNEGGLYASAVDSAHIALYRISKWTPATGDLQHFYTTSYSDANSKVLYDGWTFDGIAGYVWGIPPETSSASVYAARYLSNHYVFIPAVYDAVLQTGHCGGAVDVLSGGNVFIRTISQWTYGIRPGSTTQTGCYANLGSVPYSTFKLQFSGYVATVVNGGTSYIVYPPSSTTSRSYPLP